MFQPANRSDFNRGLAIGHQAVAKRRPVQGATMVLLLGLFGLSVFSVKMAVRNDRAAEQAQVRREDQIVAPLGGEGLQHLSAPERPRPDTRREMRVVQHGRSGFGEQPG